MDFSREPGIGLGTATALRRTGLGRQSGGVAAGGLQGPLPAAERVARHAEGIDRGRQAVFVPKAQDFKSSLGIYGDHSPKMPQSGYPVTPRTPCPRCCTCMTPLLLQKGAKGF